MKVNTDEKKWTEPADILIRVSRRNYSKINSLRKKDMVINDVISLLLGGVQ